MFSPLVVLLGSQLFKGEFWVSTNELLLAVHNNLLKVSSGSQGGLCRVSRFRNHDHSLFPTMRKNTMFTVLYKSSSWWTLRNRLMYSLYLHIQFFVTSWRWYSRNFWTLKRQKRRASAHLSEKEASPKLLHRTIWKHLKGWTLLLSRFIYVLLNYN